MCSHDAENYPMCFLNIRNYTCSATMLTTINMLWNLYELHMFSHNAESYPMCLQTFGITHVHPQC